MSPSMYDITKEYEGKLGRMKNGALLVAGLQKVSSFFGFCALTWATAVLLGGFASSLQAIDFYMVSILLLVEAARLFTTLVFSKFLSSKLFREKHRPEDFQYEDLQYYRASRVDLIGQVSSSVVAIAGFVLAVVRLCICVKYPLSGRSKEQDSNLTPALYAFYVLVILNPVTSVASAVCRLVVRRSPDDGLVCYHDEVYRLAMDVGMAEAEEQEFIDFAFKKLTRDHMRNIQPLTIHLHNRDLIKYMYHQKSGVEMACQYLKSGDVHKQQAAANLPGFWAGEDRIEKQVALFNAVSEKLRGAGKVAEGAANSLACLAENWEDRKPHPLLVGALKNTSVTIVDILVDLVLRPVRPSLVFQLRALESCCRSKEVVNHIWGEESHGDGDKLRSTLENIISRGIGQGKKDGLPRQRTRIYAASALYNLLHLQEKLSQDAKESLKASVQDYIDPARQISRGKAEMPALAETYVWESEKKMLDKVRKNLGLHNYEWPPEEKLPTRKPPQAPQSKIPDA